MSNLTRQQLLAHGHNMDAAYREIDRRDAQGEDMSRAYVDESTYAILFAPAAGMPSDNASEAKWQTGWRD